MCELCYSNVYFKIIYDFSIVKPFAQVFLNTMLRRVAVEDTFKKFTHGFYVCFRYVTLIAVLNLE